MAGSACPAGLEPSPPPAAVADHEHLPIADLLDASGSRSSRPTSPPPIELAASSPACMRRPVASSRTSRPATLSGLRRARTAGDRHRQLTALKVVQRRAPVPRTCTSLVEATAGIAPARRRGRQGRAVLRTSSGRRRDRRCGCRSTRCAAPKATTGGRRRLAPRRRGVIAGGTFAWRPRPSGRPEGSPSPRVPRHRRRAGTPHADPRAGRSSRASRVPQRARHCARPPGSPDDARRSCVWTACRRRGRPAHDRADRRRTSPSIARRSPSSRPCCIES